MGISQEYHQLLEAYHKLKLHLKLIQMEYYKFPRKTRVPIRKIKLQLLMIKTGLPQKKYRRWSMMQRSSPKRISSSKTTEAKNGLESYAYSLKRQIDDKEQLGGKISEEDKEKIQSVVDEKLEWLKDHDEASAEEFNSVKKEIEEIANPIIAKLYQNAPPSEEEPAGGHGDEL